MSQWLEDKGVLCDASQDIAIPCLLSSLATLVGNTDTAPSGRMPESPFLWINSDHIKGPVYVTSGVSERHIHDVWMQQERFLLLAHQLSLL